MDIATRLKARRIDLDLKPKEVAHRVGKSEQYVGQLEKGTNSPPTWPLLARFALAYKCSTDWILGLTDDPDPKQKLNLSPDERSILKIMGELPEHKKEELIRIAEVVLEMYRKQEIEESAPSLYDKIEGQYGKNDNTPHIIGEEIDDKNDQNPPPQNRKD